MLSLLSYIAAITNKNVENPAINFVANESSISELRKKIIPSKTNEEAKQIEDFIAEVIRQVLITDRKSDGKLLPRIERFLQYSGPWLLKSPDPDEDKPLHHSGSWFSEAYGRVEEKPLKPPVRVFFDAHSLIEEFNATLVMPERITEVARSFKSFIARKNSLQAAEAELRKKIIPSKTTEEAKQIEDFIAEVFAEEKTDYKNPYVKTERFLQYSGPWLPESTNLVEEFNATLVMPERITEVARSFKSFLIDRSSLQAALRLEAIRKDFPTTLESFRDGSNVHKESAAEPANQPCSAAPKSTEPQSQVQDARAESGIEKGAEYFLGVE